MTNKNSIFELFNMLDESVNTKKDILKHLHVAPITFHKNIQKLKLSGFKINKNNGKYSLNRYKQILCLDNKEKSAIAYMLNVAFKFLPKYKFNTFEKFLNKFLILAKEKDYREIIKKFQLIKKYSLIEEYEEKIDTLEYFIIKKQIIKITLRSNRVLLIKPVKFDWKKDKASLYYINILKHQEERADLENIAKIEPDEEKNYITQDEEIIFELYGILAKRYLLKKDERIVKNTQNSIIIATKTKDKEVLFKRLLRYDTLCKILFPKQEVNNFNQLIDKAISNIDFKQYE